LVARIDAYCRQEGMPNRTAAIIALIKEGLDKDPS